ncbi:MAG: hypothetical protein IKZ01_05950, partial [Anaerotignum sp.]|nr:hypothetical protein [Anaerotignum sp.]
VLFVTHDINEVRGMFPNAVMLRNGRIFAQGKTETLFQEEQLSKFFQQKIQLQSIADTLITSADNGKRLHLELFL